ncbi:MAG: HD domain-containing protein, partial [Spirochaetales bacterium]|nr:HD domain-containing protein [Spirochaetales bacterium]
MKKRIAAIDVGSSEIRMSIWEVGENTNKIKVLEELRVHVTLGKDIFDKARIDTDSIDESILILKRYKRLCDEYKTDTITAVASTTLNDAENIDLFLDRVRYEADIQLSVLTVSKEINYIYQAIKNNENYMNDDSSKYKGIVEVGSGSVEIIIFSRKAIVFSRSFPIGALKIKQIFDSATNLEENFLNYIKVTIDHELISIKREIPKSKINVVFGIGAELELLQDLIKSKNPEDGYMNRNNMQKFISQIQDYSEEELIHQLQIPYDYAETFQAKCFIFSKIIDFFDFDDVYIPKISLRDGIIYEQMMTNHQESLYQHNRLQLRINAINIGRKLNYDEKHALTVTRFAMKIFDETKKFHHLGDREKLYLMCASILHDVGMSLSPSSHHKHSLYIIKSQNFFFFTDKERNIVANIARYHRRSIPKSTHPDYAVLNGEDKIIVMKLS